MIGAPNRAIATHPMSSCAGDCDSDGRVTVAEVIRVLNFALGRLAPRSDCPGGGWHTVEEVHITDVVAAADRALNGCNLLARFMACDNPLRVGATIEFPQVYSPFNLWTREFSALQSHTPGPCACDSNTHVAWFRFMPITNGIAMLTGATTDYPLALTVFTEPCDALVPVACSSPTATTKEPLTFAVTAGDRYVIHAAACDSVGGNLQLALEICGDGFAALINECDDGNTANGDGCDAECHFEGLRVDQQPTNGPFCKQSSGFVGLALGLGQEFTPTQPELAAVDISLHSYALRVDAPVTVTVHDASIHGPVLASTSHVPQFPAVTIAGGAPTLWQHFEFSPPVGVVPGRTYVLEATSENVALAWERGCEYPGGNPIYDGDARPDVREDFLFRTYAPR
jgi:cysteine-rich repeat protein